MIREGYKTIAELLMNFIEDEGLKDGLLRVKIFKTWEIVVGDKFAIATINKFYSNQILYCTINSSLLRNQLFMQKNKIIDNMNSMLGGIFIKELILR